MPPQADAISNSTLILLFLNVVLLGFTGLLSFFMRELWNEIKAWRERDEIRKDQLNELTLEIARNYMPKEEFEQYRRETREVIHDHRNRIYGLEGAVWKGERPPQASAKPA